MDDIAAILLSEFPESECRCNECISACKHVPCWGTPEEIESLILAGYGKRMTMHVLTKGYGSVKTGVESIGMWNIDPVRIIAPGFVGFLGRLTVSAASTGKCTFITKDGKCELHDKNLKPIEGRIQHHDITSEESCAIREMLYRAWDAPKGRSIARFWIDEFFAR